MAHARKKRKYDYHSRKTQHPSIERPLSLIHMNLFGSVDHLSISGKTYTLVVVDDYTIYARAIFINIKSETHRKLPELMKLVQNKKGCIMVKMRSDKGS